MTNTPEAMAELHERIAALEYALESPEWQRLTVDAAQEFTREGLRAITDLARVMYLKSPIIRRSVDVKRFYVWGQGWTVKAKDERIQQAIDAFLYNDKNDDVIGSHEARMQLEIELQTAGNLFLCFFVNRLTGRIRVRTIPFAQVSEVICNPDDAKEPWYYRRVWTQTSFDATTNATATERREAYYPDWRYEPVTKPQQIGSYPVHWDRPVYHLKTNSLSDWRFGLSEIYSSIDWAKAYKEFLEDWASIVRAYRRFAFKVTTPGGARGVAAARAKLETTLGAPVAGSTFVAGEGADLQPVRTGGATVSVEDGRRLLLMVAAASGLPETFYGDASVGTLATAKSLDRPTELMMEDRQQLWRDVFTNVLNFVLRWAVAAPQGTLRGLGRVTTVIEDGQQEQAVTWDARVDGTFSIEFPPLLQHDVPAMIDATVKAATLGAAGMPAGTIDLPTLSRTLLTLLGVPDVEEIVKRLFPNGEAPEPEPADDGGDEQVPERPQAEAMMINAVRELRDALATLRS